MSLRLPVCGRTVLCASRHAAGRYGSVLRCVPFASSILSQREPRPCSGERRDEGGPCPAPGDELHVYSTPCHQNGRRTLDWLQRPAPRPHTDQWAPSRAAASTEGGG